MVPVRGDKANVPLAHSASLVLMHGHADKQCREERKNIRLQKRHEQFQQADGRAAQDRQRRHARTTAAKPAMAGMKATIIASTK